MTLAEAKPAYTPDDLLRLNDDKLYELVDGVLVEKQMGAREAWVATELSYLLRAAAGREGLVFTEATVQAFGENRATVRRPDVCFVRSGRLPNNEPPTGHIPVAPDLCVEVISPTDLAYDVDEKVRLYLAAGTVLVWVVNPEVRTVRIHRADGSIAGANEDDEITGEQVLPNLAVRARDFLPAAPGLAAVSGT